MRFRLAWRAVNDAPTRVARRSLRSIGFFVADEDLTTKASVKLGARAVGQRTRHSWLSRGAREQTALVEREGR